MRYQFKIELLLPQTSLKPIWRRVLVPADWVFEELSDVIQVTVGWEFEQLWVFANKERDATEHMTEDDEDYGYEDRPLLAYEVQLQDIFKNKGDQYFWIYNLEEEWIHRITLEEIVYDESEVAELLDGENDGPPEEIGGPERYEELVKTAIDPQYKDEHHFREALGLEHGQTLDLTLFDMAAARERLGNLNHLYQSYDESEPEAYDDEEGDTR